MLLIGSTIALNKRSHVAMDIIMGVNLSSRITLSWSNVMITSRFKNVPPNAVNIEKNSPKSSNSSGYTIDVLLGKPSPYFIQHFVL